MAKPKAPPAKKSTRRGSSAPPSALRGLWLGLSPTDVPGVFRNSLGILVDEDGVALSLLDAREAEKVDLANIVGHDVTTPAQFLKAVALDPRVGLGTRLDAAKAAAPYTDRKQPTGVDGGLGPDGTPMPVHLEIGLPKELMATLSDAELATFDKILGLMKAHGITPKE